MITKRLELRIMIQMKMNSFNNKIRKMETKKINLKNIPL